MTPRTPEPSDFLIITDPNTPLGDDLRQLRDLIDKDSALDRANARGIVDRALADTAAMLDVLNAAVDAWGEEMEGDNPIGGADMVDWFCGWFPSAQAAAALVEGGRRIAAEPAAPVAAPEPPLQSPQPEDGPRFATRNEAIRHLEADGYARTPIPGLYRKAGARDAAVRLLDDWRQGITFVGPVREVAMVPLPVQQAQAQHTPGPWRAERRANGGVVIRAAGAQPIAEIWHSGNDPAADGALVAAAPSLLGALQCMVAAMDDCGLNAIYRKDGCAVEVEALRDLVAVAEGRA